MIGFAIMLPVSLGALALALFAAHSYEVRSDLQRLAQQAALYGATRCDPRGVYTSNCATSNYPSEADIAAYSAGKFRGQTFTADCSSAVSASKPALLCRTLTPSPPVGPVPNQRLTLTLQYHFESPMAALLRIIPIKNALVDLKATGTATVE
jgi:hypothetical protein